LTEAAAVTGVACIEWVCKRQPLGYRWTIATCRCCIHCLVNWTVHSRLSRASRKPSPTLSGTLLHCCYFLISLSCH